MNGAKKFHSVDGPAFNLGEIWVSSGGVKIEMLRVERYGVDKWDADVFYWSSLDPSTRIEIHKNAWSFQVRYQHQADLQIKGELK